MKELIFILVIGFLILAAVLMRPNYSCASDEEEECDSVSVQNTKYNRLQPVYLDPNFGSASGGTKIHQFSLP